MTNRTQHRDRRDYVARVSRTKYSLLAVDGGGIRGVIPARVIQEIETRLERPACECFDMVAGTSTGGIIALGLVKPASSGPGPAYHAADLVELYVDHGRELFPASIWRRIRSLGGLADVRYPAGPLEGLLQDRFGDVKLSQALVDVVVPSYDLSGPGPFFFKRRYPREDPALDVDMWLAARATSAAPTYFEPARIPAFKDEGEHALVDGGVFANNPAVAAYADAIDAWGADVEINVVSIGTGRPPATHQEHGAIPVSYADARHWGLARWAHPLLDVVFDGVAKASEYQMVRLVRTSTTHRYHRLESLLPTANHALDDASPENVANLLRDAETLLEESSASLDAIEKMLGEVRTDRDMFGDAAWQFPGRRAG